MTTDNLYDDDFGLVYGDNLDDVYCQEGAELVDFPLKVVTPSELAELAHRLGVPELHCTLCGDTVWVDKGKTFITSDLLAAQAKHEDLTNLLNGGLL